jgi:trimethylamine corrinoid protein
LSVDKGIEELKNAVIKGDLEKALRSTETLLQKGLSPHEILRRALEPAMTIVGERFDKLEIFLPEVLVAADTMKAVLERLKPLFLKERKEKGKIGRIVIGTIEGDIHDIGKNIVATMLEAAGFDVYDLGRDVPVKTFIEKAEEVKADIIAASALMTTTMYNLPRLIRDLEDLKLREKYKVMVGGAPVLPEWAKGIGADGYGKDFNEAVETARKLVGR